MPSVTTILRLLSIALLIALLKMNWWSEEAIPRVLMFLLSIFDKMFLASYCLVFTKKVLKLELKKTKKVKTAVKKAVKKIA